MTSVSLLMSSGNGPSECHQAVALALSRLESEASEMEVGVTTHCVPSKHGLRSAIIMLDGRSARHLANKWCGTIRWRVKSTLRPQHKRANWFIGVFELERGALPSDLLKQRDVTFETFRAGGPGGQHQNTTDSAVRVTHVPSGVTVVARDERSQHRNKAVALQRLEDLLLAQASAAEAERKAQSNQLHKTLERGNPLRSFEGPRFREVSK